MFYYRPPGTEQGVGSNGQEAAMHGLGHHDLWLLAELELAARRERADRVRLVRVYGRRQPGLMPVVAQSVGRGLVRLGARLERVGASRERATEPTLRLGTR